MEIVPTLMLASASKRRVRLLSEAGVTFECCIPDVDESDCPKSVRETVRRNALLKNEWAAERFPGYSIISADTAIDFEGRMIGKPSNIDQAREQLLRFSGKTHLVLTGIACRRPGSEIYTDVSVSPVTFRLLDDEAIDRYFSLVDPLDKAGSYDIGSNGELIVESHGGSMSNIIGLPMELVLPWLQAQGYLQ